MKKYLLILSGVILSILLIWGMPRPSAELLGRYKGEIFYGFLTLLLAIGVAIVELLTRYRDEPFKTVFSSTFSRSYIGFNGVIGVIAFFVLITVRPVTSIGDASPTPGAEKKSDSNPATNPALRNGGKNPPSSSQLMLYALAASFGGAMVLRSRLITIRSGGQDISIGPSVVVDQFLAILDRQIDRQRALERMRLVRDIMHELDFSKAEPHALNNIVNGLQNMTAEERESLIERLRAMPSNEKLQDNQEKCYALGYLTLDIMGDQFLEKLFGSNGRSQFLLQTPTDASENNEESRKDAEAVQSLFTGVPFSKILTHLRSAEMKKLIPKANLPNLEEKIKEIENSPQSEAEKGSSLGFAILDATDRSFLTKNFQNLPAEGPLGSAS